MKNYWSYSLSILWLALLVSAMPNSVHAQKKKKKKVPAPTTQSGTWVVPSPGVKDKATLDAQKQKADKLKKASMPWAVSFISIGEGIDVKAEMKFLELHQALSSNGCELFLTKTSRGREGERDYCVSSTDSDCMIKFREAVDKMIEGNRLILILDDQPCK